MTSPILDRRTRALHQVWLYGTVLRRRKKWLDVYGNAPGTCARLDQTGGPVDAILQTESERWSKDVTRMCLLIFVLSSTCY